MIKEGDSREINNILKDSLVHLKSEKNRDSVVLKIPTLKVTMDLEFVAPTRSHNVVIPGAASPVNVFQSEHFRLTPKAASFRNARIFTYRDSPTLVSMTTSPSGNPLESR